MHEILISFEDIGSRLHYLYLAGITLWFCMHGLVGQPIMQIVMLHHENLTEVTCLELYYTEYNGVVNIRMDHLNSFLPRDGLK